MHTYSIPKKTRIIHRICGAGSGSEFQEIRIAGWLQWILRPARKLHSNVPVMVSYLADAQTGH